MPRAPIAVSFCLAALLCLGGFAPAAAQDASLRAAMLGTGDGFRWAEGGGQRAEGRGSSENGAFHSSALPLFRSSALLDTTLHDPWLGRDKALHAGGSFLLTLSAQYVLTAKLAASEGTALPLAAGTALSLGLAKEVLDGRRAVRPHFSTRDLVADAVGVVLAVGLILL